MTSNAYVSPTDLYVDMSGGSQRANPWVGFLQEDSNKMYTGNVADTVIGWESPYELQSYEILSENPVPVANSYNFYANRGNNPPPAPVAPPVAPTPE
jgi:hypothetical protein